MRLSVNWAIGLDSQLRQVLEKGEFRLTKWYSNSRELLAMIPGSEAAKSVKSLELDRIESAKDLEDVFGWDVADRMLQ